MPIELFALLGAIGIALTVFVVVVMNSDNPIKASITATALTYLLTIIYIYLLKHKEEKHTTDPHKG